MASHVTDDFLACLAALPGEVRERARRAYRLWAADPTHPGLRFKPIRGHDGLCSGRVGLGWRAVGRRDGDAMAWI